MKQLFLLIMLVISSDFTAQTIPRVSEPVVNALYRFYPNLIQLTLSNDDYNEYILVNDSCEVLLVDKNGVRLAPNNFIVKIPAFLKMDSIHFKIFNRSNMREELAVFSFDIINPPTEVIYLDGIKEGGKCSKRPVKMEARTHEESPVNLIFEVEYWWMEIGDKQVFGKDGEFDDYVYSVLAEFPIGTEVTFNIHVLDEAGYSSFSKAVFYLE